MSKKYTFEFRGTMEDFLNVLDAIPAYRSNFGGKKHYSFDKYIVEIIDGEMRFGVNRAGYSDGYWYVPTVTEYPDRVVFCGEIRYMDAGHNSSNPPKPKNWSQRIGDAISLILFSPILLIAAPFLLIIFLFESLYDFVRWTVCKILHLPNKPSNERKHKRKLNDLMQRHLHCTEQDTPD